MVAVLATGPIYELGPLSEQAIQFEFACCIRLLTLEHMLRGLCAAIP